MRRICCFCETWESGGIESFLNNVLQRMDLTNAEVDIVAACIKESVFTAGLEKKGIRFVQLSGGQRRLLQNFRLFRNLLRERRYDVVHFNLYQGLSLYYVRIAQQEGVSVRIAHSHNTALRKSGTRYLKLLLHWAAKICYTSSATDLWACSQAAAEFLFASRDLAQKGFRFIPNGIETERFRFDAAQRDAVRKELGLADAFVIGNIGRLCYQKNQSFLLDVFGEIVKQKPYSRLLLVGEGEDKIALEGRARRLGIADTVIFFGTTDHVEQLLWAMDVFVFPSRFEGLGIVAIEAQAANLPIICSENIPPEAFITNLAQKLDLRTGPAIWAKQIISMERLDRTAYENEDALQLYDGINVSEKVKSKYSE